MQLLTIYLKNFRCFSELSLELNAPLVLIKGTNGAGKTSLLEALHYACYLRSFRTFSPRELMHFQTTSFFIKLRVKGTEAEMRDIQVGFADNQRLVKVNQKSIATYKELIQLYRIITLTEDDLLLVRGAPEYRRTFVDHVIALTDPAFVATLRKLRSIVENRQALFKSASINRDMYHLWTEQLINSSAQVRQRRIEMLEKLQTSINELLTTYCNAPFTVTLTYRPKEHSPQLEITELESRRSLFGAHLDDFIIAIEGVRSRDFASRGQQKLLVVLAKIAHAQLLVAQQGHPLMLIDDFMSDLDSVRVNQLLSALLGLSCQIIFTSPVEESPLTLRLVTLGAQEISLTH